MIYTLGDKKIETVGDDFYVAPSASVIGRVRFGLGASVWFNCVVRGDSDWISIGDSTNVQDGTIIHTDEGVPTILGAHVSIGHGAIVHGCTVGDYSLVANGAIVLDRVTIGKNCLIAAGALVPPGRVIPDGSVVMGSPGKIVRATDEDDRVMIERTALHYVERGRMYRRELRVAPESAGR